MRVLLKLVAVGIVVVLAGCASQESVDTESPEPIAADTVEEQAVDDSAEGTPVEQPAMEMTLLDAEGIAGFETGDGATATDASSITLSTGGSASGRLIPTSSDSSVTLYMTRDGSSPSATNNWGGPIDPVSPPLVTRQLEGSGVYKIVAEQDGQYSDVFTVYAVWQHEESPALSAPTFEVGGRSISGSVELSVSDGSDETLRLYIVCDYVAATLYISRDGTDPTPETFWKSQVADGTYLFSPEPTAAAYRVIAVWQDGVSPVASLDVAWTN
jgi:hypothetical protein